MLMSAVLTNERVTTQLTVLKIQILTRDGVKAGQGPGRGFLG